MGYFATLAEARHWAHLMRSAYPNVFAAMAPEAVLRQRDAGTPTLASGDAEPSGQIPASSPSALIDDRTLTNTQVLQILETDFAGGSNAGTAKSGNDIPLGRPDDTDTRRLLTQAIVQSTPAPFAIQLRWSMKPIDVNNVPSLPVFSAYTLYLSQGRLHARSWYALRLGFFSDEIAAKPVANSVRPHFDVVAVVPVSEQERTRGIENRINPLPVPQSGSPPRRLA